MTSRDTSTAVTPPPPVSALADERSRVELSVRDLRVSYRTGATGVDGISFELSSDRIVSLLGPNGAGKTSALRAVAGFLRRDVARITGGTITYCGQDITRLPAAARRRLGIICVPERDKVFTSLSVEDNLRLAGAGDGRVRTERLEWVLELFPALKSHLPRRAGFLSGGQRQMLAISSALMCGPRLLVIDELTMGLSPEFIVTITREMRKVVDAGLPVILAEQRLDVALALSDRVHVLSGGRIVGGGTPDSRGDRAHIEQLLLQGQAPDE